MRLTLRTILAYLDDVLEPAQARELGERIAEGKESSALVSRIRDVLRRRRIGAPELAGPGSGPDPNVVSDYLENLLPPDQVVELERLCQTSDMHLAEVAGCHKILTMVLGQPIDVADDIRERMYALGAAKVTDQSAEPAPTMTEGIGANQNVTFETGLPEYLTRRTFSQRYGMALLILLVAGAWMGLVVTDRTLWERPENRVLESVALDEVEQPAQPGPAANPAVAEVASKESGAGAGGILIPASPAVPPVDPNMAMTPPMPQPAVAVPMPVPMAPGGVMPASPMETSVPVEPAVPVIVPVAPVLPLTQPELPMVYLAGDEVVIRPHSTAPGWVLSGRELPIQVGDSLASPAPFRNSYKVGDVLTVNLQPSTRIQRQARGNNSDIGFLLEQGQLNLFRSNESTQPITVRLNVLGRDWSLKLLEPGTRVGIELTPNVPNGPPTDMTEVVIDGGIVVAEGKISVSTGGATVIELGPNDGYARWPSTGTGLVTRVDLAIPAWATADGPLVTPATRQFGKLFQKEFNPGLTVEQSLSPIVRDRRVGMSELAVKTLALIGSWQELIPALKNDHQESRLAAIVGLRHALATNPGLEPLFREEIGKNFSSDKVDVLVRLLWGFNFEDARSPEESGKLVGWLKDDEIAVRELAFHYISKLTARTFDYLPMAPVAERRAAIHRWEEFLKRNNGSLLTD